MERDNTGRISFSKKPIPVPISYRPMYKISEIILILKIACIKETSSLLKLHLFSWAFKSDENTNVLRRYIENGFQGNFEVWGIEPSLNRALQFVLAEGLCGMTKDKKYKLTLRGSNFFEFLVKDEELFKDEKLFLKFVGKTKITDSRISEMSKSWVV